MASKKKAKRRRRNILTSVHRTFIVQQVACYATPQETADAVYTEFGLKITPQNVEKYDHTKQAGARCAKKWAELYERTRKNFLEHIDKFVPEANKAVRVRQLANASRAFKGNKNFVAMADMLERIAKEVGDVHTNRREVTGRGGGPIKYQDIDMMTEEEVDRELQRFGIDSSARPDTAG